jgi:hypothetical protein
MSPQAVRVKDKQNAALPVPFLAHYKDEHFVAVFRATGDKVRLYDSRVGFQNDIPLASFRAQWSGYAITLAEPAGSQPGLAVVTGEELNTVIGGCCGVMPSASKNGDPAQNSPCATGPTAKPGGPDAGGPPTDHGGLTRGSPSWWVNPVSLNMVVADTPMWWGKPVRPGCELCADIQQHGQSQHDPPARDQMDAQLRGLCHGRPFRQGDHRGRQRQPMVFQPRRWRSLHRPRRFSLHAGEDGDL